MHFGIFSLFFWNATAYAEPSGDNSLVQKVKDENVLQDIVQEDSESVESNTKEVPTVEFEKIKKHTSASKITSNKKSQVQNKKRILMTNFFLKLKMIPASNL